METDMETDTDMVKDTDMELEYFAKFPYGTIVAISPYVLPVHIMAQFPTALSTCSAISQ
jgi:hypothetical protein